MDEVQDALSQIAALGTGRALTTTIATLESNLRGANRDQAVGLSTAAGVTERTLDAALVIKALAGQINVVVHAVGILVALPYILDEDETVLSLSLGAGNTGRNHDLETDRQIGEFKFIEWRGGAESIRQNSLFVDLFNLASTTTTKRRVLYVVGRTEPMRFLRNRRSVASVLSKNSAVANRFRLLHGDAFPTVRDYYESVEQLVEIVDLREIVPGLSSA